MKLVKESRIIKMKPTISAVHNNINLKIINGNKTGKFMNMRKIQIYSTFYIFIDKCVYVHVYIYTYILLSYSLLI